MKQLKIMALGAFTLVMLTFASCTKDPCADVDCGANGTCDDGSCACEIYYEGDRCQTEWREKTYGTYLGEAFVDGVSAGSIVFNVEEFSGYVESSWVNDEFYLDMTSSTTFDIPDQRLENINGERVDVVGYGTINGKYISFILRQTVGIKSYFIEFEGIN